MMYAADYGFTEAINLVIKHQCGKKDADESTALIIAIEKNNYDIIQLLAKKEQNIRGFNGKTVLMIAIEQRNDKLVKYFINQVGKKDNIGQPALFYAILSDQIEFAKILMNSEQDLVNKKGQSALMISSIVKSEKFVELFINQSGRVDNAKMTALMHAVLQPDNMIIISKLREREMNIVDGQKMTVLMHCAKSGNIKYLDIFVDQCTKTDINRQTALMHLVQNVPQSQDEFSKLIQYEAGMRDVNGQLALNFFLNTVIYRAFKRHKICQKNIMNLLIQIEKFNPQSLSLLLSKEISQISQKADYFFVYGFINHSAIPLQLLLQKQSLQNYISSLLSNNKLSQIAQYNCDALQHHLQNCGVPLEYLENVRVSIDNVHAFTQVVTILCQNMADVYQIIRTQPVEIKWKMCNILCSLRTDWFGEQSILWSLNRFGSSSNACCFGREREKYSEMELLTRKEFHEYEEWKSASSFEEPEFEEQE